MRPHANPRPASRAGLLAVIAAALLVLAGCGPSDPLDAKVSAEDGVGFSMWRSHAAGDLSPEQLGDFDQAVQAIRIRVMSVGQTSGSEGIEEGMRRIVDGKTVREVLRTGLGWKLELADAERMALEDSLRKNAQLLTRPGDTASANYLSDLRDRQTERLRAATEEVARIRDRLAASGLPPHPEGRLPVKQP